jgi:Domain of unknown function (DUF4136)
MSQTIGHRITRLALAVTFFGAATVAGAQDVGYNAMPNVDFAKYKTYAWVKIKDAGYPDDIADAQVKTAIDSQLAAKGLTKADADSADLLVGYQVKVDQEKQWNAYGMGGGPAWGWGSGYYGYGYGGGMATATSTTLNIGTLALDMYDRTGKQLVWRGMASKTLDPKAKPEKRTKNLNKAMAKMLKNYPPPPKKG